MGISGCAWTLRVSISGSNPAKVVTVVIRIGRARITVALTRAS